MTFSFKRVTAILVKDYKDFSRNTAISIMLVFPPLLAALFHRMGMDSIDSYYMLINMTFAFITAFVQCCLIAEEKEKNTLRGLMLSPASTTEILSGKSLLSLLLTAVVLLLTFMFLQYSPKNIVAIVIALLLSAIFYTGIGTILGLFAKSVLESTLIVLPVVMVLTFGSAIMALAEQYPILSFVQYLPNLQLIEIAIRIENGAQFSDVLVHFGVLLAWGIAAFLLSAVIYRKRMVD